MADVPKKSDYVDEGLHSTLAQFRSSPKLNALLAAPLARLQELEDTAQALHGSVLLSTATGASLDLLGSIVGENRMGRVDNVYRIAIGSRVILNTASGRLSDLGAYLTNSLGPLDKEVIKSYPASFGVYIAGNVSGFQYERIAETAFQTVAAGVLVHLFLEISNSDRVLRFAPGNSVVTGVNYGFAQDNFTGGGHFVAAFGNGAD